MFTIKGTDANGHAVHECASYRFRRSNSTAEHDSIDLFNAAGEPTHSFIIDGTTYAMNSAGKTIDTFHARPTQPTADRLGHPLGAR